MRRVLTTLQKRAILQKLSPAKKKYVRKLCSSCSMRGDGISSILTKVKQYLGPIARQVGPTILKDFIIPYMKKKAFGGNGLKLAGRGGRRHRRRKTLKKNTLFR